MLVGGGGGRLGGIKALQIKALVASESPVRSSPKTVASAVVAEEKWHGTLRQSATSLRVQG